MKKNIGIIKDTKLYEHSIGQKTRECPERLRTIYNAINNSENLINFSPRLITDEELFFVHSELYINAIKNFSVNKDPYSYDKDTYLMEDSLNVAKLAAGGCICLADAIITEKINRGFALVRPPGHHAEQGRGMGFCILNNAAITAKYLINKYKLDRIMIIDFDVHHANGTQDIFYNSSKTLVISIHQNNLFPFSGMADEFGADDGFGYNINIPVNPQYGDPEYSYLFGKVIQNIADQYLPQFILVSAGFDCHADESISDAEVTTEGFIQIAEILKYLAHEYCEGKLLYLLEGGYNLAVLEESVKASLQSLVEADIKKPGFVLAQRADSLVKTLLEPVFKTKWSLA